ncbi:MAG: 5'/3'-nucleotidase SurE [Planctomycetota bacterium]|nr:5'/3'-nucleotidase SurE [Planctomycetota bacterium]
MKILVTNDDGIDAPGIAALVQAASEHGQVVVVAPSRPVSGASHQVTVDQPLVVHSLGEERYAVDGSPADCARAGLLEICPDADWVLAGINLGANLGVDVWMSGTVGAVREAALLGCPAIAWSQYFMPSSLPDWTLAATAASGIFSDLQQKPRSPGTYWNVNFPESCHLQLDPACWQAAALDNHPLPVHYEKQADGYHYRCDYQRRQAAPGSDVATCFSGTTTVTQLEIG